MAHYRELKPGHVYILKDIRFTRRIWSNVTNEELAPLESGDKLMLVRIKVDGIHPNSPYTNFIVLMGTDGIEFAAPLNISEFIEEI